MRIIDSQVHVWRADSPERPWPKGDFAPPHMTPPLGYERLLTLMDEAGVARAVLVPPSWEGNRPDYVLEAAAKHPDRFGVMARIALDEASGGGLVTRWKQQPGMLGVRLTFVRPAEQEWLRNGTADWFWAEAERADVPVMVHAPESTAEIDAIAKRHPGLKLILDHMGLYRVTVRDTGFARAIERTLSLSGNPNIYVKVSSLPFYSAQAFPFAGLYPHVRRVIEAFGPQRSIWGTDLSKMLARFTYKICIDHILQLDFLSQQDKEQVLGGAFAQCVGWG